MAQRHGAGSSFSRLMDRCGLCTRTSRILFSTSVANKVLERRQPKRCSFPPSTRAQFLLASRHEMLSHGLPLSPHRGMRDRQPQPDSRLAVRFNVSAVTGDGDVRRKLYTDGDLYVFAFRRCIIITGTDLGSVNGDLSDRLLPIHLRHHSADKRSRKAHFGRGGPKLTRAFWVRFSISWRVWRGYFPLSVLR